MAIDPKATCGHDCACPNVVYHAAQECVARYDAPIPSPSAFELVSILLDALAEYDESEPESQEAA